MHKVLAAADPDAEPRQVALPAGWNTDAAAALAALAPGTRRTALADAAETWIAPLDRRARDADFDHDLGAQLHRLLLLRRGAPEAAIWRGETPAEPGFVLNLAAFHDPAVGFDMAAFAEAVDAAVLALSFAAPDAMRLRIGFAGLGGLFAALGLDYRGAPAQSTAACLAALLRGAAEAASARLAERLGARASAGPWPPAPAFCAIPGLAETARAARQPGRHLRHAALTAIGDAGAPEALLGVGTGGLAPAFSPLDQEGRLSQSTLAWLAARGLSAEAALAAMLRGESPLPVADEAAHAAMHDAVAPYVQAMPARPLARPVQPAAIVRRELPARRAGYTQKASVGSHRVFLKTGEYADGSLGEVFVTLPKDNPSVRSLMDSLSAAVSLGLQHGVPLDEFVDALVGTGVGSGVTVEGDPAVHRAGSLSDYVFRHLAVHYLGRTDLPEIEAENAAGSGSDGSPLLPLDLPPEESARQRRRGFRVVRG
jgi:hypothetical protein